jgi:hypothetical protein
MKVVILDCERKEKPMEIPHRSGHHGDTEGLQTYAMLNIPPTYQFLYCRLEY